MRETIINSLVTLMDGITQVNQVIKYDDLDRIASTGVPAVMVIDAGEERFPRTGGFADVYLHVYVRGVVRATDDAETRMNSLDKDIKTAIAGDRTLSGIAANVTIGNRDESDLSGDEDFAVFTRSITVYYVANEANGE